MKISKKLTFFLIIFLSLFSFVLANNEKITYKTEELVNSGFDAKLVNEDVKMIWNSSSVDFISDSDWRYWKIIRSSSNSNPVYPEDGYIKYDTSKSKFNTFIDLEPKNGINYYRICAITKDTRYCSNVVKIENLKLDNINNTNIKQKNNLTTNTDSKIKTKNNLLTEAQNLLINKKLDSISSEKKIETYNKLILKIEKLSLKYNSKTRQLLQEIKLIIQERISQIDSNLLIDDIFNGIED